MKQIRLILLFVGVAIFFIQCIKTNPGERPPVGPTSSDSSSSIITVVFANHSVQAGTSTPFSIAAITQGILDSGQVQGYIRTAGTLGLWHSLPYIANDGGSISIYSISLGILTIFASNNENIGGDFKFEIIPHH